MENGISEAWAAFLRRYYENPIMELANNYPGKRSLEVTFQDIDNFNPMLAERILGEPDVFLEVLREELRVFDLGSGVGLDKAHVRITNLPVVKRLEEINPEEAGGKLVSIAGVVLRLKRPEDKIKTAVFQCPFCAHIFSEEQPPLEFIEPVECPEGDGGCGRRPRVFKLLVEKCRTIKAQQFSFQEVRGKEKGEIKEIEVEDDLIDKVSPGDEIKITGIIRYYQRKKKDYEKTPYLDWRIEVNTMEKVVKEYDENTRGKAIELLKDPEILDRFAGFLEEPGLIDGKPKKVIVGEKKNKRLLFLVGLSAKYPRKIHNIIVGQSSAGKSRLASLLNLYFPERVEDLFRTSARALDYLQTNLEGKILLIKEMAGGQSSDYSLRIVMDPESDELRILTVVKDEKTNEQKTVTKITLGNPVFVSTTTTTYFDVQTKNRAFLSPMDESEDQTKRILEADRKGRQEMLSDLTSELQEKRCALDMLQPIGVKIPFEIEYPTKSLKARRSAPHLSDLIEMVAFLHQYQRQFIELENGEKYLIATPEDFEIAKDIAEKSLSIDIAEISPNAEKLYELFKKEGYRYDGINGEPIKVEFTLKKIRENASRYLGRNYARESIRNFLNELDDVGLIVSDEGKPKKYYLLEEPGESPKIPNVRVKKSLNETELSKWVNSITTIPKRIREGIELLNFLPKKIGNGGYKNGVTREAEAGERKVNANHWAKMGIPEGDKKEIKEEKPTRTVNIDNVNSDGSIDPRAFD